MSAKNITAVVRREMMLKLIPHREHHNLILDIIETRDDIVEMKKCLRRFKDVANSLSLTIKYFEKRQPRIKGRIARLTFQLSLYGFEKVTRSLSRSIKSFETRIEKDQNEVTDLMKRPDLGLTYTKIEKRRRKVEALANETLSNMASEVGGESVLYQLFRAEPNSKPFGLENVLSEDAIRKRIKRSLPPRQSGKSPIRTPRRKNRKKTP